MIRRFKILKKEYRLNFKLSLIASLIICILLFLFFPYISPPTAPPPEYQSLLFTINDLAPNSTQKNIANPRPPEPKIFVPDVTDEPEILPDEDIVSLTNTENSGSGKGSTPLPEAAMHWMLPNFRSFRDKFLKCFQKMLMRTLRVTLK